MRALWSTIIAPILGTVQPSPVVDYCVKRDALSKLLLETSGAYDGDVHVVPSFEIDPAVTGPQFALVRCEPNWHSVTERLDRLAEMAKGGGAPLAVTLVHGADWPTGRRDRYSDPATIPLALRQPHAPGEPQPGQQELVPPSVIGAENVQWALSEHDQRNGVLTAVEDFLERNGEEIELIHVPGLGGTAILVPEQRLGDEESGLSRLIEGWRLRPEVVAQLAAVEAARAVEQQHVRELEAQLAAARAGTATQQSSANGALRERLEELSARHAELVELLARRESRLATLEGRPAAVPAADRPIRDTSTRTVAELADLLPPSAPLPLDRAGVLIAAGGEPAGESRALHALVHATGDPVSLSACLWSLLARTSCPLRLTIRSDADTSPELRSLIEAVVAAEPAVETVEGEWPEWEESSSRLIVSTPISFSHGAVDRLLGVAEERGLRLSPASAQRLGVPRWAGPDAAAIVLAGEGVSGATEVAAPCTLLPSGASAAPGDGVCLGAVAGEGATSRKPPDEAAGLPDVLHEALEDEAGLADAVQAGLEDPLSIVYVLPGLPPGGSGGSHSVFQEAVALRACGMEARVAVASDSAERAAEIYPEAVDLIEPYAPGESVGAALAGFDVVVATQASSVVPVREYIEGRDDVLGAYYVQDYEPLISTAGGPSADAAVLSYRRAAGMLLYAKTHWIVNQVGFAHGLAVAKVDPSLDRILFQPGGRAQQPDGPIRIAAMIRLTTPRRQPVQTLRALERLAGELGDGARCISFGCAPEELEGLEAAESSGVEHLALLSRGEVAELLRRTDIFLDCSEYQAFGRTGLEAMACGAVPVLPERGGVREYAEDGHNSVLVDTVDEALAVAAAIALAADPDRLQRLRANGITTSRGFSATRSALSQYACFAARRAAVRLSPSA